MFARQVLRNKLTARLIAIRNLQLSAAASSNEFVLVQIDVPWGKIERKLWGAQDKQPILCLHGWMDNAGSYDPLSPLLKDTASILAIDLPGHGASSWLPRGTPYNVDSFVLALRHVIKRHGHGWSRAKLMGGLLAFDYARLYPGETEFVISVDYLGHRPDDVASHSKRRAKAVDEVVMGLEDRESLGYAKDVTVQKWVRGMGHHRIDASSVETLMIRGAERREDGSYSFTCDLRLRSRGFVPCYSLEQIRDMAKLIECPYLVFKAYEWPGDKVPDYWTDIAGVMSENCRDFRVVGMDGPHHLHMSEAEKVASEIVPFLEKYDK